MNIDKLKVLFEEISDEIIENEKAEKYNSEKVTRKNPRKIAK